eukprot:3951453-Prorocentrum_lima.AAC.1
MWAVSNGTAVESERMGACLDTLHCNSNPDAKALNERQEGVVEAAVARSKMKCKQESSELRDLVIDVAKSASRAP